MSKVYVREQGTNEIVETIDVTDAKCTLRHLEKLERGLLRNMDTDRFFYDDEEAMVVARENAQA